MSQTELDPEEEIGNIMLRATAQGPPNRRCFTLLCSIVHTSNFADDLALHLPEIATKLWPWMEFTGVATFTIDSFRSSSVMASAFRTDYPAEFVRAHRLLETYELSRIEVAKAERRRLIAFTRNETVWDEATSGPGWSSFTRGRANRLRFRDDVAVLYLQKVWYCKVNAAMYVAGCDPEQAIQRINHLFANPIPSGYEDSQTRSDLSWLAERVTRQAWLLSDFPEDVAFYREFRNRMMHS